MCPPDACAPIGHPERLSSPHRRDRLDVCPVLGQTGYRVTLTDTQEQILDATITCVASDGVDGTSLRNVAREADVSLGLLGYHFDDKGSLIVAAFQRAHPIVSRRRPTPRSTASRDPTNAWPMPVERSTISFSSPTTWHSGSPSGPSLASTSRLPRSNAACAIRTRRIWPR